MQSNLTKSFPLFLADGEDRTEGRRSGENGVELGVRSGEPIREDKIGKVV